MAKIRDLKKDVEYLTTELISQAYFTQHFKKGVDPEKLNEIVAKAIVLKNNTITSINNPDGKSSLKQFFSELQKSFIKSIYSLFDELNSIK